MKKILLVLLFLTPLFTFAQVTVPNGGTGKTVFPAGGFLVGDTALRLTSTTSPTVGYITATSTNATTTLQKTSVVGAISLLGEYFTNFTDYVRSLFSASAPITYSAGGIGCTTADTSHAGCVTSTDWNTFNNKQASLGFTPISNSLTNGYFITGNPSNVAVATSTLRITYQQDLFDATVVPELGWSGSINLTGKQVLAIDHLPMVASQTSLYDMFFGGAGNLSMTGTQNNGFGYFSLNGDTNGSFNQAFGSSVLGLNTSGSSNNGFGGASLRDNTTGSQNNAFGNAALLTNKIGSFNVAIGSLSNQVSTSSSYNTTVGYQSGFGITYGFRNVLIGDSTLTASKNQVTTGYSNIAIGDDVAVPSPTTSNQLTIGNLIYGVLLDGTGSTISTGRIGIGTTSPFEKLTVAGNFFADGNIKGANLIATGTLSVNGKATFTGTAPTMGTCGTSPALRHGSDVNGLILVGGGTVTSCTLNFSSAWTQAPDCVVSMTTTFASEIGASTTPTTLVIVSSATMNGKFINYICHGWQ